MAEQDNKMVESPKTGDLLSHTKPVVVVRCGYLFVDEAWTQADCGRTE